MELDAILVVEDGRGGLVSRYIIQSGIPVIVVSGANDAYDRLHRDGFQAVVLTPSVNVGPLEFVLNARDIHNGILIVVPAAIIDSAERSPLYDMPHVWVVEGTDSEFAQNAMDELPARE
ncbi:hypothetical protein GF356_06885 [candidate division GN15 bacterium]|nr:hypothetical protein [candidate division GN15 bacterium]